LTSHVDATEAAQPLTREAGAMTSSATSLWRLGFRGGKTYMGTLWGFSGHHGLSRFAES